MKRTPVKRSSFYSLHIKDSKSLDKIRKRHNNPNYESEYNGKYEKDMEDTYLKEISVIHIMAHFDLVTFDLFSSFACGIKRFKFNAYNLSCSIL